MVLYILTGYRLLGFVYLDQLTSTRHTHISYHNMEYTVTQMILLPPLAIALLIRSIKFVLVCLFINGKLCFVKHWLQNQPLKAAFVCIKDIEV